MVRLADGPDTTSDTRGDLGRYLASRRRMRGWHIPSGDPVADAQTIAEALGPRSYVYVCQMLAELAEAWPVDDEGRRIDYEGLLWRLDRFGGTP